MGLFLVFVLFHAARESDPLADADDPSKHGIFRQLKTQMDHEKNRVRDFYQEQIADMKSWSCIPL